MKYTLTILVMLIGCDNKVDDTGGTATDDTGSIGTDDTGETSEVVSMVVDNHMLLCSGEGQWLCPQVKIDGGDWSALGCGVDGLDYEWGTTYTLTAEKVGFSDPASDGCGDVYELVEVQDSTFDGASRAFEYFWVYNVQIKADDAGGGVLLGVPFLCADESVCAVVATVTNDWQTLYNLELENPAKMGDALLLTSIEVAK